MKASIVDRALAAIVTTDSADFRIYRRFKRQSLPLLTP